MGEKPIDAVAVLVGFLSWCNEAPNQGHPVVQNTRSLCDALSRTLREKAALESRVAELEKVREAARYLPPDEHLLWFADRVEEHPGLTAEECTWWPASIRRYHDAMLAALRSTDPQKAGEQADIQKAE